MLNSAVHVLSGHDFLVAEKVERRNDTDYILVTHVTSNLVGKVFFDGSKFTLETPGGVMRIGLGPDFDEKTVKTVANHLSSSFEKGA